MLDKNSVLAIVGLGYVGLPLAIEFGKTRRTIGFDISQVRIDELKLGIDSTLEINAEAFGASSQLEFTADVQSLESCDVYIVTVPTPIDSVNRPNLSPLRHASESIAQVLKRGDVVIYESTVYPGCTEEFCVPILESVSGLAYNVDFFCGYSPERINPGDKINTLTKIKKIVSGSTLESTKLINDLYLSIIEAGTYVATSIKVAEAAKVIENSQRDLNIAFVNELSVIFDRLNIDTMDVLEAAGTKWNFLPFRPGMVGGHCIGVDPYYLTHKAEQVGYNPQVILAGRRINDNMARYVARNLVKKMVNNGINVADSTVTVLGVTFKENCPDIRNSKIIDLVNELKAWNINVLVSDPWADSAEVSDSYGISLCGIDEAKSDALVVAVGHDEFRILGPELLISLCKGPAPIIADVKSLYDRELLERQGFTVFRL
ncbi:nucleotide sugar dehydrogenase [Porticoccaceae bacterium]|nr:nucleotide sugar dehydrogenase [Porticoccaceae bacterium]